MIWLSLALGDTRISDYQLAKAYWEKRNRHLSPVGNSNKFPINLIRKWRAGTRPQVASAHDLGEALRKCGVPWSNGLLSVAGAGYYSDFTKAVRYMCGANTDSNWLALVLVRVALLMRDKVQGELYKYEVAELNRGLGFLSNLNRGDLQALDIAWQCRNKKASSTKIVGDEYLDAALRALRDDQEFLAAEHLRRWTVCTKSELKTLKSRRYSII